MACLSNTRPELPNSSKLLRKQVAYGITILANFGVQQSLLQGLEVRQERGGRLGQWRTSAAG